MKKWISWARDFWAAFNEIAMAPIAFVVFGVVYCLITWLMPDVPLPGPSRLVGPMWGAFLVFVGWAAGTFSFYWNCRERFLFLFRSGPGEVFQQTKNFGTQLTFREYREVQNSTGGLTELWMSDQEPKPFKIYSTELFRCHVLYLWHCSIFVFGLVLSQ